jgi:hypothetical protein
LTLYPGYCFVEIEQNSSRAWRPVESQPIRVCAFDPTIDRARLDMGDLRELFWGDELNLANYNLAASFPAHFEVYRPRETLLNFFSQIIYYCLNA